MTSSFFGISRAVSAMGLVACSLLATGAVSGCGMAGHATTGLQAFGGSVCDAASAKDIEASELVILDWTGGVNQIYPGRQLKGIDLTLFGLADGGTLGDRAEAFKKDVLDGIAEIYCAKPALSIRVINGEDVNANGSVSIVHITQEIPPHGGSDVGEGEYDPCNLQSDNAAILYGERLRSLSDAYRYEEWVNVFANICAHEIGHTLGFGHVARDDYVEPARSIYIELMLDGLTMSELKRQHRFLVDLSSCPNEQYEEAKTIASVVRPTSDQ